MIKLKSELLLSAMVGLTTISLMGCNSSDIGAIDTKYVSIPQTKGLTIKCTEETEITDKAVEDGIPEYLNAEGLYDKDTKSPVAKGDNVNIDFEGMVDGVTFDNGSAQNYDLTIGSGTFVEGFEDQIIGHKAGDSFNIVVTFPKDYQDQSLANKEAVFKTTLNYIIKSVSIPDPLTDEFIKTYTSYDTVDAYKHYVREDLEESSNSIFESNKEAAVTTTISDSAEIKEYPEDQLKDSVEKINEYYHNYADASGQTFEETLKSMGYSDEETFNKEMEEASKVQLKTSLIDDAILEDVGLEISDKEYKVDGAALAKEYNYETLEDCEKEIGKDSIMNVLEHNKVVDYLIENNKIVYEKANNDLGADLSTEEITNDATGEAVTEAVTEEVTEVSTETSSSNKKNKKENKKSGKN